MSVPYSIYDVTNSERTSTEQMGTKRKFWCRHPDGHLCLFKFSRSHAGEDWSEKIAADVAEVLGIPHAHIDLAAYRDKQTTHHGTIARDFTDEKRYGSLIHGNELLLELDPAYPKQRHNFRVAQHTLDRIFTVLGQEFVKLPANFQPPLDVQTACDLFVGYLLLDALITNTDRHHENWGILLRRTTHGKRNAELAPTFDHASSLGRELTDERRADKIKAESRRADPRRKPARRDQTIVGYLEKDEGRSRIFLNEQDVKPLHAMDVFRVVREKCAEAAEALVRPARFHRPGVSANHRRVPSDSISTPAREFCLRILELTRAALVTRTFTYA